MTDHVIDASALVFALIGKSAPAATLRAQLAGMRRHAPHLIDAEMGNVLRRHERAGHISGTEADTALRVAGRLVDHRYAHVGPLAKGAWSLRHSLSFYDALYVALASNLGVPLLTADIRLSRAPDLPCRTELV
ncbi:type II toxin-antitoxin system VapC family toxin [Mycolicibacterium tusciae]|uniref:type II toxin-antitoxin system VapC family toxin n=1 Tax=Mycolicibacterium tusciae TaxID=75922 RepID=UPI00024A4B7D|nr:type II toxin-antitoxin system VapC family toxin [Mycolicibacterium tusciae]